MFNGLDPCPPPGEDSSGKQGQGSYSIRAGESLRCGMFGQAGETIKRRQFSKPRLFLWFEIKSLKSLRTFLCIISLVAGNHVTLLHRCYLKTMGGGLYLPNVCQTNFFFSSIFQVLTVNLLFKQLNHLQNNYCDFGTFLLHADFILALADHLLLLPETVSLCNLLSHCFLLFRCVLSGWNREHKPSNNACCEVTMGSIGGWGVLKRNNVQPQPQN